MEPSGSLDMPFGADYAGQWGGSTSVAPSESFWDFLPNGSQIVDTLVGAGVTRAAYEINKPLVRAGARSPLGTFGKVGTVGVELGSGTQTLILLALLGAGIYLLSR
ncbi:MAG: hypothetical protein M0Z38_08480 [Deltaproteobacteria bacterium]|nr:hypothetical protein [Deltaproteobacteria bacterium]